ncbi:hypothetical protein CKO28_19020 [Rhodovibrio sodomensis]|uniref:histidine kinase n=1 Tax=Rhodovibrio sodomensis TaxID=1088 RepID=A0ABS1DJG2_9PROT|nr:HAMP domain-containing sensor histidine kinase [Rhodovibrio sodomensis]MBK1670131.1 hypothetical protein [Rhodovibrio sodomensis]
MTFYRLLSRLPRPKSFLGKILFVSFVGVHIPLIAVVLYLLLTVTVPFAEIAPVLLVLLIATVAGTVATSAAIYGLLAPVRSACTAIRDYLATKKLSALPTGYTDQAGVLMADVQEAITRLDRALDAAQAAAERAHEDKAQKFRLLSDMSHELRTPLNHILGFSELIQNEMLGPLGQKAYANYAGDIRESGGALLDLVQSVLEVSAVEAGSYQAAPERIDLADLAGEAVRLAHIAAQNNNITVDTAGIDRTAPVDADPRALKQVLSHYLLAVIRKAEHGGQVHVSLTPTASGYDLVVEDTCGALVDDDIRYLQARRAAPGGPNAGRESDAIASASAFSLTLMLVDGLLRVQDAGFHIQSNGEAGKRARFSLDRSAGETRAAA